jgi:hypothetical protein
MIMNLNDSIKLVQDLRALHHLAVVRAGDTAREFTEALEKHGAAHAIATRGEALVASEAARELWDAFVARWSDASGSEQQRRLADAVRATLLEAFPEPSEDGWFEAAVGDARGRETHRFRKQMQDVQRRIDEEERS